MDEENPTNAGLTQENKWFWLSTIRWDAVAGKRLSSAVYLRKRV
jgi:hypothetical protein